MVKELLSAKLLTGLLSLIAVIYLFQVTWGVFVFFSDIILILFLAWLLSFIIEPLIGILMEYRLPRFFSASVVYIIIASLISSVIFMLLPVVISQLFDLSERLPYFADQAPKFIDYIDNSLKTRGVNVDLSKTFAANLNQLSTLGLNTADKLVAFIGSFFNALLSILLVLIISFYLVLDGEKLEAKIIKLLPDNWQDEISFVTKTINTSFAGFLRGQLSVALIWGVASWLTLTIVGSGFAPIGAITGGLLMIIPVIGGFFGIIPPLASVLISRPDVFWLVLIILTVIQVIEVNILAPIIFEKAVGLHPVLVLVSFLIGFKLGGGWGALFAVPIGSISWVILKKVFLHFRENKSAFR